MKFKVGDKVKFTDEGISEYKRYFSDGVYTNLEIRSFNPDRKEQYTVWQHDKSNYWYVGGNYLELEKAAESDPNTWKRNTPIIVTYNSGSEEHRHFCKYENGRVYFYPVGKTSWSYRGKSPNTWVIANKVRRATKKELK